MKRNRVVRTVNFSDCDPAQIVFYPRFYEWFDRGTEMLFRSVGLHWEEMMGREAWGGVFNGVPLVETSARYMYPCRFGDTVTVDTWIDAWKGRTFTVRHDVYNGEQHAVEGREVRVWALRDTSRPSGLRAIPVPEDIIDLFRA